MRQFGWFIGAFAGAMTVCLLSWWLIVYPTDTSGNDRTEAADTLLLDISFPMTDLTDAVSGDPVKLMQASLSDAVVIILGGIGCSGNQVEVLKRWNDNQTTADSTGMDIIAVYADPLMGVELSRHESLLLRRASQVDFPTLVYEGQEFNPRSMGIQTPQVVRVRNGRIAEMLIN